MGRKFEATVVTIYAKSEKEKDSYMVVLEPDIREEFSGALESEYYPELSTAMRVTEEFCDDHNIRFKWVEPIEDKGESSEDKD